MDKTRCGRCRSWLLFVVIVIGVAVFDTAAASATPPEWKIKGSTLTKEAELLGSLSGTASFTFPPISTVLECSSFSLDEFKLQPGGLTDGTMLLGSCITLIKGNQATACNPLGPIIGKLSGALILHGEKTYILFKPLNAKEGAAFVVNFSEECVFYPSWGIGSTFVAECSACESEQVNHTLTVNLGIEALFTKDILNLEATGETRFILGASLDLGGANKGLQWSGLG